MPRGVYIRKPHKVVLKRVPYLVGDICVIPLPEGLVSICDAIDYEKVKQRNWSFSGGYGICFIRSKATMLHRFILGLGGEDLKVDHIDRNGLNNRRSNLRLCTDSQNSKNASLHKNSKSGYRGVCWCNREKKWLSQINCDNKRICLGYFDDKKEAALAYDKAAIKYHKEFASLNFPKDELKKRLNELKA